MQRWDAAPTQKAQAAKWLGVQAHLMLWAVNGSAPRGGARRRRVGGSLSCSCSRSRPDWHPLPRCEWSFAGGEYQAGSWFFSSLCPPLPPFAVALGCYACAAAGVLFLHQRYGQQKDGGREENGGGEEDRTLERDGSRQVETEMHCLCVDWDCKQRASELVISMWHRDCLILLCEIMFSIRAAPTEAYRNVSPIKKLLLHVYQERIQTPPF